MLIRLLVVIFYAVSVVLFTLYIHLVGLFNQMNVDESPKAKYEYIIVGAGTGGLTVAAGLQSDDVLILEAGGYTTNLLDIPMVTPLLQNSAFDWGYYTVPQTEACLALKEQRSRWPSGRGFGGSQILNYMLWTRGNPDDYETWFSDPDDFDYAHDVEQYFDKSESDLEISDLRHQTPLAGAFVNATTEYGSNGCFIPRVTQRNGKRWTYAHKLKSQSRLGHEVHTNSFVRFLLFDGAVNRVNGLVYEKNGYSYEVFASKGVILSAGTIGTPSILQMSGIGPAEYVKNLSISLRKELPVGHNLQDHVTTGVDLVLLDQPIGVRPWDVLSLESLYKYFMHGTGPMTMCGCEAIGFASNNSSLDANLGFMVLPVGITSDGGTHFKDLLNIDEHTWNEYFDPLIGQHTVSIMPIVVHPKSRGTVQRLAENIHINPNYLSDERDVDILVKGLRILEQLLEMPALKKLGAEINPKPMPGCEHLVFRSPLYWRCYVRRLTLTAYHPVGTCRMGADDDPEAVVNRNFQVLGVDNLWVVDASVMPSMPSGNPNAVVSMLANRFLATFNHRTKRAGDKRTH